MNYFALICLPALSVTIVAYATYSLLKAFLVRWYATALLALAFLGLLAAGVVKAILLVVALVAGIRHLPAPVSQATAGLLLLPGHATVVNASNVSVSSLVYGGFAGCGAWLYTIITMPRTRTREDIEAEDRAAANSDFDSIEEKRQTAAE